MTKLQKKIIKLMADYPEKEFYGQEVVEKIKCSKGSANGILKMLADKKIVFKKTRGHMKFYRINQNNPDVKRFKIGLALETVKPILAKLKGLAIKIILFGSASRGEQTFNSDIDLFILANHKERSRLILKKINQRARIKAIIKTPSEWSELEIREPEFYQEIKNGIILYNYVPRV